MDLFHDSATQPIGSESKLLDVCDEAFTQLFQGFTLHPHLLTGFASRTVEHRGTSWNHDRLERLEGV